MGSSEASEDDGRDDSNAKNLEVGADQLDTDINPLPVDSGLSRHEEWNKPQAPVLTPHYTGNTEKPCRRVHLLWDRVRSEAHIKKISERVIFYDKVNNTSHIWKMVGKPFRFPLFDVDRDHIVVYIKGLCHDNNKAAWSVNFGPGSKYNRDGILRRVSDNQPMTPMAAEAEALYQALELVFWTSWTANIFNSISYVLIASDASYLVSAAIEPKDPVAEHPLIDPVMLTKLQRMIETIDSRARSGNGVFLRFWHVSRKENMEARRIAEDALEHDWDKINWFPRGCLV
ncbi:hypothetical protein GGR54DRAFT_641145 [Hypoxylon sp. NC1633]|nr:hypothetical protein GGR54DRAFT_641145 [Hypoxylon sp. NC1633]